MIVGMFTRQMHSNARLPEKWDANQVTKVACAFLLLMFLHPKAYSQLVQGTNTLRFEGIDDSGVIDLTGVAYFSPSKTELTQVRSDGSPLTESGFTADLDAAALWFANYSVNYEGTLGTWMDSRVSPYPAVLGGVHPYLENGSDWFDTYTTASPGEGYKGFIIMQSGSTWYGDLTMNSGTTLTADNLIANSITTGTVNATGVTTTTLTVTGGATVGGTLNMSNNRISNVADGIAPTDAVNMRQLDRVERDSRAGISSVAALAGIPSMSDTEDGVLGVGVGTYKGESSIAVGATKRISDSATFKFGVGTSTSSGSVTGSFGIGIKW